MAKNKIRCGRCGKRFLPANAKQTFCPECEAKLRADRTAAKSGGARTTVGAAQAPKIVGPGAAILVPGLVAPGPDVPPELAKLTPASGATPQRDGKSLSAQGGQGGQAKPAAREGAEPHPPRPGPERSPQGERAERGRPARPPRPPKEPRPAPPAFDLTEELRTRIEQRYLELAQPVEFDGIRTQIAGELSIPKSAVKKAVMELRTRMQMPSWWELQTYTGGSSELDRIRRAYEPYLPVPPIGVHKTLAEELALDAGIVYQGIKRVRAEMRLPRFNPPELHEGETAAATSASEAAPASVGSTAGATETTAQ